MGALATVRARGGRVCGIGLAGWPKDAVTGAFSAEGRAARPAHLTLRQEVPILPKPDRPITGHVNRLARVADRVAGRAFP